VVGGTDDAETIEVTTWVELGCSVVVESLAERMDEEISDATEEESAEEREEETAAESVLLLDKEVPEVLETVDEVSVDVEELMVRRAAMEAWIVGRANATDRLSLTLWHDGCAPVPARYLAPRGQAIQGKGDFSGM
jgi:hypothetical protein